MPRPTNQLREFARLGAQVRLKELRAEIALVNGLLRGLGSDADSASAQNVGASAQAAPARKRRKMSATGRARIAAAQRKRWAAVKAAAKSS